MNVLQSKNTRCSGATLATLLNLNAQTIGPIAFPETQGKTAQGIRDKMIGLEQADFATAKRKGGSINFFVVPGQGNRLYSNHFLAITVASGSDIHFLGNLYLSQRSSLLFDGPFPMEAGEHCKSARS